MAQFTGTLNSNTIFSALYNMIISQQVFADNIKGTKSELVNSAKVDGTLYGDTKLYYTADVLTSSAWGNDAEAANLLKLYRPTAPKCQKITLDIFRQICLTTDQYLSKQAWSDENSFGQFTSVIQAQVGKTKEIYDATTYNTYIGTAESSIGKQQLSIDVTSAIADMAATDIEGKNRVTGSVIANSIADLLTDLIDLSRDYNDYGVLESYDVNDLIFIWNAQAANKIEKRDLPTIYHEQIMDKFKEFTLPSRYFGTINAATVTTSGAANTTIRSTIEQVVEDEDGTSYHLFAGDLFPNNVTLAAGGSITYPSYTVDSTILFKVTTRDANPYMSAFQVATNFFNPKSLTSTEYLTYGHNTLDHLSNRCLITARQA